MNSAIEKFDAAVRSKLPTHRTPTYAERQRAIAQVAKSNPKLHVEYLSAMNPGVRASRLLVEKYENAIRKTV